MTKKRKPLNDTLAKQFVYGESPPPEPPAAPSEPLMPTTPSEPERSTQLEPEPEPKPQKSQKLNLMDKLQAEVKEPTKRFTLDLVESLHRKLSLLSARTGRSKAEIVRILLEEALQDVKD